MLIFCRSGHSRAQATNWPAAGVSEAVLTREPSSSGSILRESRNSLCGRPGARFQKVVRTLPIRLILSTRYYHPPFVPVASQQVQGASGDAELVQDFQLLPRLLAVIGTIDDAVILFHQLRCLFRRFAKQVDAEPADT